MQDYRSLRIMICATLVNTQTDRQLLAGYTISSASRAKKSEPSTF